MSQSFVLRKGNRLEYLVAAVFQGQGFLVRRNVPLPLGLTGGDATDIDVLAVKLVQPFQPSRVVCDCKDRQRSRPFERVFWAKGLGAFVKADEVYVALPKCSAGTIDFARSGQVRVLTADVLEEAFRGLYGEKGAPYGLANAGIYGPVFSRGSSVLKRDRELADLMYETRSRFVVSDPYTSFNWVVESLKRAARRLHQAKKDSDDETLWRIAVSDLVTLGSLLLLYVTADTIGFAKPDRRRYIVQRLTYGDLAPSKAEEIFAVAQNLANEAARSSAAANPPSEFKPINLRGIEPPPYAYDVEGLVERAHAAPEEYSALPRVLDVMLFEQAVPGRAFDRNALASALRMDVKDLHLKSARNILALFRSAASLDPKLLWPKQGELMPRADDAPGIPDTQLSLGHPDSPGGAQAPRQP